MCDGDNEIIQVEDIFQITGRGSVLAGRFMGHPNDERLVLLRRGAAVVMQGKNGTTIPMQVLGMDVMRNPYIDFADMKECSIGILVDRHITMDMIDRLTPLFLVAEK